VATFHYRLQPLLDQRTREKDDAFKSLADVQKKLKREQEELGLCLKEQEAANQSLMTARTQLVSHSGKSVDSQWLCLKRLHIQLLVDNLSSASDATRAQEVIVDEAKDAVTSAVRALARKSQDVNVLEKHRARLEGRFVKQLQHIESIEQEEMANLVFLRGRAQ
jgi:flagellar biosynthesis chaperone FliJ